MYKFCRYYTICLFLSRESNELCQIKKNIFSHIHYFWSLGMYPQTSKAGLNFFKLLFSWGRKSFQNFFLGGRLRGVVLWVDLTYIEKLNYYCGDYLNSKLIYNMSK